MKALTVGDRPPRAALVHGHGLCGEFYIPFAEQLADRGVSTVLFTLPGYHGEAPLPVPGWAALVDAVLAAVPPGAALIGHSMGGLLALLAAGRRPPISHLVLLEPLLFANRGHAVAASRQYLRVGARPEGFENWNGGQWRVADPDRYPKDKIELFLEGVRTSDPATVDALFSSLPTLTPLPYDRIAAPTLLVTGSAVGWRGFVAGTLAARGLRAERFMVPDAGHWLVNEHDDVLADAVAAFLGKAPT